MSHYFNVFDNFDARPNLGSLYVSPDLGFPSGESVADYKIAPGVNVEMGGY